MSNIIKYDIFVWRPENSDITVTKEKLQFIFKMVKWNLVLLSSGFYALI